MRIAIIAVLAVGVAVAIIAVATVPSFAIIAAVATFMAAPFIVRAPVRAMSIVDRYA